MLFMVVETFRGQNAEPAYKRIREEGRVLPEGLSFLSSWVTADLSRCFQVMEAEEVTQLQAWAAHWSDLVELEIIPVVPGSETAKVFDPQA